MLLIKNGLIYTIAGKLIDGGDILIEDGKIKEVGKNIEEKDGVRVIDASGKIVTPGLIDAHSHIGLSEDGIGSEGNDHNERVDPVTPQMRALDGINPRDYTLEEARAAGVTTAMAIPGSANVVGGEGVIIKLYGDKIDDMVVKSPAAMKIAFGENPKRVYSNQGKTPATRMGTAGVLRELLFKTKEYLAKKEGAKKPSEYPAFDMKLEAMIPVIKKEIPLKAHAHRADDILTAIRIAKEFDVDLTLDHCTEGHLIADHVKESGYYPIVGPSFGRRSKFELKNKGYKTPKVLADAGVEFAITTDSPVIPLDHLPLTAGLAMREGLDEMTAFKSITINPAKIMGIDDRLGSIEVGKDADIVIFDGHPLKDVMHRADYTIIDGKIVFERK